MSFTLFKRKFFNEQVCIDFYIRYNLDGRVICPNCNSSKTYSRTDNLKVYQCRKCKKNFSPFTNSIFKKTHIPLSKWYYTIYLHYSSGMTITVAQLQRDINVSYKTAWRMLQCVFQLKSDPYISPTLLQAILHLGKKLNQAR